MSFNMENWKKYATGAVMGVVVSGGVLLGGGSGGGAWPASG